MTTAPYWKNWHLFNPHILCFFLLFVAMIRGQNAVAQVQKPNIIFILGDDIGYNTLTVNGGRSYSTPNLDSMAHNGMNFTQCHTASMCSPSRFMLLTGKYNFRNYTNWGVMDTAQRTIGNMLQNAGYKTACFGKWQFNGGDASIKKFGFENYCVFDPYDTSKAYKYKNPHLYTNGNYIPNNLNAGKYGEDIFTDSVLNFIDINKATPFFIYYAMGLAHGPFQPTPDDTDFAKWNSHTKSDTSYYASMIKYMDKKIGEVVNKVNELGIENNTIIIYAGDNGTPTDISQYVNDDSLITGGKSTTTEFGTHVPLIIYWPNTIIPGMVNNDLVDFTDFLPTLANVTNIPVPDYGPLDGVSFSGSIINNQTTSRSWIFNHFPIPSAIKPERWAQTLVYKLYDTSSTRKTRMFYNIKKDIKETSPINDADLTPDEITIKQQLLDVINSYVVQGVPLFSIPFISSFNDSSAVLKDSILIDGGSTITSSGFAWSGNINPTKSSAHSTGTTNIGLLSNTIKGLLPNKIYYVRAYSVNLAGTTYSKQISFKTLLHAPLAKSATSIDSNQFVANWNSVGAVSDYKLDVSTFPSFTTQKAFSFTEGFNNGIIPPYGWVFTANVLANTTYHGLASPSLLFNASQAKITTKLLSGPAKQLKFWIKGINTDALSSLLVEGYNGSKWIAIITYTNLPKTGVTKIINTTSNPSMPVNVTRFRFTYTKSAGTLALDDVSVNYDGPSPSFVTGYNNLNVTGTSKLVKNLKAGITYYYRVRAVIPSNHSNNSNVITVTTCKMPAINNIEVNTPTCNGNDGSIKVTVTGGIGTLAFYWTGTNDFTSSNKDITNLSPGIYELNITANGGCKIDTSIVIPGPVALNATATADTISCAGSTTILTVNATGGTGNYHYTLSDGTNSIGPQNDNHFTVSAGNYTVLVEDDNHCSFNISAIQITEPTALNASATADTISCAGGTTELIINTTGGTGNYHYTLSDGTNTVGPQDDNHFTVAAGNYIVTIRDDNGCTTTTFDSLADGANICNGIASIKTKNSAQKNKSAIAVNNNLNIDVFPNPALNEFILSVKTTNIDKVRIYVTDVYGRIIYQSTESLKAQYKFGRQFSSGIYFLKVMQGEVFKTFKLIKEK